MSIKKFAMDLLNEVAEECDERVLVGATNIPELFIEASKELSDLIELLVEAPEED